jgi:hypothetical protein
MSRPYKVHARQICGRTEKRHTQKGGDRIAPVCVHFMFAFALSPKAHGECAVALRFAYRGGGQHTVT